MYKLILLATLVALSCAYDFSDPDFNQMLIDDIRGSDSSSRYRRDTDTASLDEQCHGRWKKNIHCCNGDTFAKEEFEKFFEAKHECSKEAWGPDEEPSYDPFNCEQLKLIKDKSICLAECMMKKIDAVDEKGFIKRDVLVEHFKTAFKDTEWKAKATEGIIDKCLGTFDKTLVDDKKCNLASMHMIHCTWKEYIQACPKELQNQKWKCNKIREKIEKGDLDYLKRVHFQKFIRHHEHDHDDTVKKE